jgi:hypothetical protein
MSFGHLLNSPHVVLGTDKLINSIHKLNQFRPIILNMIRAFEEKKEQLKEFVSLLYLKLLPLGNHLQIVSANLKELIIKYQAGISLPEELKTNQPDQLHSHS